MLTYMLSNTMMMMVKTTTTTLPRCLFCSVENASSIHFNLTQTVGDVHHFNWRATKPSHVRYAAERDAERFLNWKASECITGDCIHAHSKAEIIVDIEDFLHLFDSRLPFLSNGSTIQEARLPFPTALD